MQSLATALVALAAAQAAAAAYCGVVTSTAQSYRTCEEFQYPAMDAACTAVGGTVGGHLRETGDSSANCITYCNNVATGGHDETVAINSYTNYHLYVVDSCSSCSYCGGSS